MEKEREEGATEPYPNWWVFRLSSSWQSVWGTHFSLRKEILFLDFPKRKGILDPKIGHRNRCPRISLGELWPQSIRPNHLWRGRGIGKNRRSRANWLSIMLNSVNLLRLNRQEKKSKTIETRLQFNLHSNISVYPLYHSFLRSVLFSFGLNYLIFILFVLLFY